MHPGCDRAKSETQGSVGGLSASQRLQAFLKLIRWPNLMMMALTLWLIRYSFFQPLDIPVVLSDGQFALLVLSTLCIGAAGYVVNDLYDLENDRINKPERMTIGPVFSEDEAWRAFGYLFLAGGLIGLYLGWITGKWGYGSINLITGFWLFLYASDFKGRPLLGNLLISFLSAGVLTYPLFFDVLPRMPLAANDPGRIALLVFTGYFCFAFALSLLREWVKDLEDVDGDDKKGLRTMPIAWGRRFTSFLAAVLGLVLAASFGFIAWNAWPGNRMSGLYILLLLAVPCFLIGLRLFGKRGQLEYRRMSLALKAVMALAILSIPFFTYSSL